MGGEVLFAVVIGLVVQYLIIYYAVKAAIEAALSETAGRLTRQVLEAAREDSDRPAGGGR